MPIVGGLPNDIQNGDDLDADLAMENWQWLVDEVNANAAASGVNDDITELAGLTVPLTIPQGGTGADDAPEARRNLNIESIRNLVDANYSIVPTDRVVLTSVVLTAARVLTLPAASSLNPGQVLIISDILGTLTNTNTLTINRTGADTINGATSALMRTAYRTAVLISNGVSKWAMFYTDIEFPVPVASGGTGNGTKKGARGDGGLNIDSVSLHGDSDFVMTNNERTAQTSAAFTAPRAWTLPAASGVNGGETIMVIDTIGGVTATNTLSVGPFAGDTINGSASAVVMNGAFQFGIFVSDGISKWTARKGALSATKAQMETATEPTTFVTPLMVKNSPGVAKAWGFLTDAGAPTTAPTISAALNVASVTHPATGQYVVNFTANMGSTSYAIVIKCDGDGGARCTARITSRAAASFAFTVEDDDTGDDTDFDTLDFSIFAATLA